MQRLHQLAVAWIAFALVLLSALAEPLTPRVDPAPSASSTPAIDCEALSGIPCVPVENFPTTLEDGVKINFFHYKIGDSGGYLQHINDIGDTAKHIIPILEALGAIIPEIVIILVPTLSHNDDGVTVCGSTQSRLCFIKVADNKVDADGVTFKNTIVHELYHVIQNANHQPTPYLRMDPSRWWREGSAQFFGDYYYSPQDQAPISLYDPTDPLYDQIHKGYPAGLFFFSLTTNGISPSAIHKIVMRQLAPTTDGEASFNAVRTFMSTDADIVAQFPRFAQNFIDAKITFPSLTPIVTQIKLTDRGINYQPTVNGPPGSASVLFQGPPFTMQWAVVTLQQGQTITFQLNTRLTRGANLYYRVKNTSKKPWIPFPSTVLTVKTACPGCGNNNAYEFLYASTRDADVETFNLVVTRKSVQKCRTKRQDDAISCPIEESQNHGFVMFPLKDPTTDGAFCPSGTVMTAEEAW
jgi:hypothetical protein